MKTRSIIPQIYNISEVSENFAYNIETRSSILIDTGASAHILTEHHLFTSFDPDFNIDNCYLELANGSKSSNVILGRGDALVPLYNISDKVCNIKLTSCLYVPSFRRNIMSYYCARQDGLNFDLNTQGEECMYANDGNVFKINTSGNLYILYNITTNTVISRTINDWHRRFGHCNIPDIMKLPQVIDNMHIKRNTDDLKDCEICIRNKFTKHISKIPDARGESAFQSVHVDLNGPIVQPNESEYSYIFGSCCDFSQFISVYLLGRKSDTPEALLKYISDIAPFGKISKLRSDNGGEFSSRIFRQILIDRGIRHETSAPYSPEMLGHIERAWRTLFNSARCLLDDSNVPIVLWPYAIKYAVYTRNRCYQRRIDSTPLEKATNKRPNLTKIQLFGCKCYMYVQHKTKLEPRAKLGVFLGYHENSAAKVVYDPNTDIFHHVKDVKCLDSLYYQRQQQQQQQQQQPNAGNNCSQDASIAAPDCNTAATQGDIEPDGIAQIAAGHDSIIGREIAISPNHNNLDNNIDEQGRDTQCLPYLHTPNVHLSDNSYNLRQRTDIDYSDNYVDLNYGNIFYNTNFKETSQIVESPEDITHSIFNIQLEQNMMSNYNYLAITNTSHTTINVPNSYKQAIKSPEWEHWQRAMDEEIASLRCNNTYTLVTKPHLCDIVGGRWVYSVKQSPDNNLRFKARYVAKGYTQLKGLNYNDTYAPTARMTSIRILMAMVVQSGYHIHHVDVNNAYLNSDIDYLVFMSQPEGYVQDPTLVCKLHKSIYGLKQSAAMWHSTLISFMETQNLKQSVMDPCVFVRNTKSSTLIILIWVDDCIIAASNVNVLNEFKRNFGQAFRIKDLGQIGFFLGMQFEISQNIISINQKLYTQNIIKRFNEQNCKLRSLPCDPSIYELLQTKSPKFENPTQYRELIGSLIYLMTGTRPDISFIVTLLSRYMNKPLNIHMTIARGVLGYLANTLHYDLKYVKTSGTLKLYGYSDSDWASDNDRQSVSGYAFKLNPPSALISWRSGKQNLVATSSCEAEYIALHEATCEALFLRQIYAEFTNSPTQSVPIFVDNQGCICLAKHPSYHKKTRHIDIKFHSIRKYVSNKSISVIYVNTKDNIADICTKALKGPSLRSFSIIRGILPGKIANKR